MATRAYLGLAHVAGGAARTFGPESLQKEQRRDGVPFLLLVLAVVGGVVEWFFRTNAIAQAAHLYTFGGLFGQITVGLPVLMVLLAIWLFRHPASVHDNGRIGVGSAMLVVSAATIAQVVAKNPQPEHLEKLASGGGVAGWLVVTPLEALAGGNPALPAAIAGIVLALSVFVLTKTPPSKLPQRLRDLHAYLFDTGPRAETPPADVAARSRSAVRRPTHPPSTPSATTCTARTSHRRVSRRRAARPGRAAGVVAARQGEGGRARLRHPDHRRRRHLGRPSRRRHDDGPRAPVRGGCR